MVIPERDTPGMSARICETPMRKAPFMLRSSISIRCGRRSAIHRRIAKTERKIAICHGCPRWSSIALSPSAPAIAAGMVAKNTPHARRSWFVRIARARTDANQAATYDTRSDQK